ncbi:unnamed protein product, partial [Rotaria magnacalcarata]
MENDDFTQEDFTFDDESSNKKKNPKGKKKNKSSGFQSF